MTAVHESCISFRAEVGVFIDTDFSSRGYAVKDTVVIFGGVDIKAIGVVALFPFVDLGCKRRLLLAFRTTSGNIMSIVSQAHIF